MKKTLKENLRSPRSENHTMTAGEWSLLLLLSVIWGGSFPFMKVAVRDIEPMTLIFLRISIGALVLVPALRLQGGRLPRDPASWKRLFIMAFFNNVIPFNLIAWGLQHIDSSFGSILNATTPIFSVILVQILTRSDRLTVNRAAGVLIGWVGVAALLGLDSLSSGGSHLGGQLAILGASCSYALGAIYSRRTAASATPAAVSAGVLSAAAVQAFIAALIFEGIPETLPSASSLLAVAGLGVLCTGGAYLIYYRLLNAAGPTNVLLVTFLVPVTSVLLSVLMLNEQFSLDRIIGSAILFLGLITLDGRLFHRLRKRSDSA
jgi:drug/metabolite transporter (DMT)-like permease